MIKVVFIPVLLCVATAWLYLLAAWWAPTAGPSCHTNRTNITNQELRFPRSLEDLKDMSSLLQCYYISNLGYVYLLFASAYIYKQAFAIPGSVFLNVLAGALFGVSMGFPLTCVLTTAGASCCFLMSKFFGKKWVVHLFPDKVAFLQSKVAENKHRLLYFLLFLRLFPMTPNWFLNMASPVVNIPLHLFAFSVFVGLMPYNYICVQTGVMLSELGSLDNILSTSTFLSLLAIAVVAVLPGLFVKQKIGTKDE